MAQHGDTYHTHVGHSNSPPVNPYETSLGATIQTRALHLPSSNSHLHSHSTQHNHSHSNHHDHSNTGPSFIPVTPGSGFKNQYSSNTFSPSSSVPSASSQYQTTYEIYSEGLTFSSFYERASLILQRDQAARSLFVASFALAAWALFQLVWSLVIEIHTLFSASFWTLFMSMNLGVTFAMKSISKERPTMNHSYGYNRFEVVAAFTNGSLVVFVALYVLFEAIEGFLSPLPVLHFGSGLIVFCLISLVLLATISMLYLEIIFLNTETISTYGMKKSKQIIGDNIGALITCLIPPLASLLVAISGSAFMDHLLTFLLSMHFFYAAVPLCWKSGRVLLQSVPSSLSQLIDKSLHEIKILQGVSDIIWDETHFWTYSPGVHVGTVKVAMQDGADQQAITSAASDILGPFIKHLTVQVESVSSRFNSPPIQHHHGHSQDDHDHEHSHDHTSHSHYDDHHHSEPYLEHNHTHQHHDQNTHHDHHGHEEEKDDSHNHHHYNQQPLQHWQPQNHLNQYDSYNSYNQYNDQGYQQQFQPQQQYQYQ